jgi:hypothetical protein
MDSAEILVYWRLLAAGISESGDVPNGYAVNAKTLVFAAVDCLKVERGLSSFEGITVLRLNGGGDATT